MREVKNPTVDVLIARSLKKIGDRMETLSEWAARALIAVRTVFGMRKGRMPTRGTLVLFALAAGVSSEQVVAAVKATRRQIARRDRMPR